MGEPGSPRPVCIGVARAQGNEETRFPHILIRWEGAARAQGNEETRFPRILSRGRVGAGAAHAQGDGETRFPQILIQ